MKKIILVRCSYLIQAQIIFAHHPENLIINDPYINPNNQLELCKNGKKTCHFHLRTLNADKKVNIWRSGKLLMKIRNLLCSHYIWGVKYGNINIQRFFNR